jgi:predicted phosphoadenosine phosphosulfate sulfurtransferase
MTFEEFVPEFGEWFGDGSRSMNFVGIRTAESLNRWRTIFASKGTHKKYQWTTRCAPNSYNAYPLYDWAVEDVWTYFGTSKKPYNPIYDRMHRAGLTLSQMRICEPYGDEQRRGLWLYHVLEPETWGKVVARVAGANSASLYAGESGNILGNRTISKPPHHTWESFAKLLLDTMPPETAEHYRDKFSVWRRWYEVRGQEIADELPNDIGAEDLPSWRRLCKVLLRNDYWCKTLCFSPTKADGRTRYHALMKRRRDQWGISW